jgi:hypothetical protein
MPVARRPGVGGDKRRPPLCVSDSKRGREGPCRAGTGCTSLRTGEHYCRSLAALSALACRDRIDLHHSTASSAKPETPTAAGAEPTLFMYSHRIRVSLSLRLEPLPGIGSPPPRQTRCLEPGLRRPCAQFSPRERCRRQVGVGTRNSQESRIDHEVNSKLRGRQARFTPNPRSRTYHPDHRKLRCSARISR